MTTGEPRKAASMRPQHYKVPRTPDEKGFLIGGKCKSCGDIAYPKRVVCPKCGSQDLEETELSDRGKIYAYTIVQQTYPMTLLANDVPFISAQVVLPEKACILAQIRECDLDKVKVGMDVELCFWKATQEGDKDLLAPAFKPVSS